MKEIALDHFNSPATEIEGVKLYESHNIWRTIRLTPEQFCDLEPINRLVYSAICAHTAPSTHNTQPWAFKLSPENNSIEVYLNNRRVLPASDTVGRQACISVGCSIANLSIATEYFGYVPVFTMADVDPEEVKPVVNSKDSSIRRYIQIASAVLPATQNSKIGDRELFEALFTRRVNRGEYDANIFIDKSISEKITSYGKEHGVSLHLLTRNKMQDRLRIQLLADAQRQADNFVINTGFRNELGDWFIENESNSPLGMPGDTFGLQDKETIEVCQALRGEAKFKTEEMAGLPLMGKRGIETAPLVGIITVANDQPKDWINAGIVFGKIAILMEKNHLATAVHAGLAEVDFVSRGIGWLNLTKERPVLLFRAGKPTKKMPHSPRLKIEDVILQEN